MNRKIRIPSEIKNLRLVEKTIDEISAEIGIKENSYGKILVATLEAVNNAIMHGNKANIEKFVEINFSLKKNELRISIKDEGKGFKPSEIPDPTKPENIENLHGRGVFLMSRLADRIEFNKKGNKVVVCFKDIRS